MLDFSQNFGNLAISVTLGPGFDELKVFASDLFELLFILKLATFLQPLKILYLHNVNYLKLSLIILIYCVVTFTDLILEKGFMTVGNVRFLICLTN